MDLVALIRVAEDAEGIRGLKVDELEEVEHRLLVRLQPILVRIGDGQDALQQVTGFWEPIQPLDNIHRINACKCLSVRLSGGSHPGHLPRDRTEGLDEFVFCDQATIKVKPVATK